MRVHLDGKPVVVFFRYGREEVVHAHEVVRVRTVTCEICPERLREQERTTPLAVGVARCSPQDHFERVEGRRRAFTRAVQASGADKRARADLWRAFRQTHVYARGRGPDGVEGGRRLASVRPAQILIEEFLKPWNLSAREAAMLLGWTWPVMRPFLLGDAPITEAMARDLQLVFGANEAFWMALQRRYDYEQSHEKPPPPPQEPAGRTARSKKKEVKTT